MGTARPYDVINYRQTQQSHLLLGNEQEDADVPLRNHCFKIKKAVVVLKSKQLLFQN
jgi:hypothetical protein